MPLPNLSELSLRRLGGPEEDTGANGRTPECHMQQLFRMPGDVMYYDGIFVLFFKALRANLERCKPGYYNSLPALAQLVPLALHTDTDIIHKTLSGDYDKRYDDMWKNYLSAQGEIIEALKMRWSTTAFEIHNQCGHNPDFHGQYLYNPPYLHVNPILLMTHAPDNASYALNNTLIAEEIIRMVPQFGLHGGAFGLQYVERVKQEGKELGVPGQKQQLSDSILKAHRGPLDFTQLNERGDRIDLLQSGSEQTIFETTYELLRELPICKRREIYKEFFDLVARYITHEDGKPGERHDYRGSSKLTLEKINTWEKNMVRARLFLRIPYESPSWNGENEIGLQNF